MPLPPQRGGGKTEKLSFENILKFEYNAKRRQRAEKLRRLLVVLLLWEVIMVELKGKKR